MKVDLHKLLEVDQRDYSSLFSTVELEDQSWFPTVIRDLSTDYIHFIEITFRLHRPVVPLLAEALRTTQSEHVIDLCSGGGGPIPALQRALAAEGLDLCFTLTDRFPNLSAFHRVEATSQGRITYAAHAVDARAVPKDLKGFRTIFNSFHHFGPTDAKAILRDAAEAGEPIGIFEIPERTVLVMLPVVFTPLFVALATPFIRPLVWRRLFWTYVVPLVPLTCLWDGIVSQLRAYTVGELDRLTQDLAHDSYQWRTGQVPIPPTHGHVTYLLGYRRNLDRGEQLLIQDRSSSLVAGGTLKETAVGILLELLTSAKETLGRICI